jgi:class 3 adenylate cyclase/tetratricopeptide (TPR) repeat protein
MPKIDQWLEQLGLGRYAAVFSENDIDLDVLPDLSDADLAALGVSLGHRKKLLRAIAGLAEAGPDPAVPPTPTPRAAAGPERRHLTVMFCDLVGSTELSTRLDPEDLRDVMQRFQECCVEVIGRYGGYIGNYIGDGILAYFGYPRAHEDDAQRAVRAGLGMVEAIAALNGAVPQPGIEMAIRVGINTGLVVVGDIGTGESRDEMAVVGETPNVAARLQGLAEPGSVVVGASTYRLIEGLFVCEDLGALEIKGVRTRVPAYRVREPTGASRFEATTTRGLTPLVGREDEVRLLLSRWRQAKEGEGQVVLLSGEAGIGKSRIIQSLRERLQDEPRVNLHYFCSPFYSSSALYPALDQLERAADFRRHDPPTVKLEKLEALLAQASPRPAEAAALLAPLLAIATEGRYPPLDLTPQRHRAKVFTTFLDQLVGLAERDPVLMICEDAHWIDPTSIELFQQIVDRVQRLPVLLVMIFRPDFAPPWSGYPHITSLSLGRLGHRQAAAMVERVTGGKPLPFEVVEQIVARTDGVPLFVEELTKTILESDLLVDAGGRYALTGPLPALAIPTTLHDSLMARLDKLAPVKEVAQLAATLGRVFSHELLAALSPLGQVALEQALSELVEAELLFRRGSLPEVTYEFKHALLQDAAYGSLLRAKRQQLHARIGQVLEERFPHIAEARPELLAHHFREAGLPERAIPYALQAGDAAVARYAAAEARARYGAALEMARSLPPAEAASRARITAVLKLAGVAGNRDHFERDLKNLAEAEALAEELEDQEALCQIEYWIGRTNYVLGRFDDAAEHARAALAMAEAQGNGDTAGALPINLLARIHCLRGEAPEAIAFASRNVEQMRRLGNRIEEAAISGVLAFGYGLHGEFTPAFEAAQHGIELARKVEHLPTLAACLHFRGVAKGWHGEIDDSVADFEEALACSEKAGDMFRQYLIYGWRGEAHLLVERMEAAEADLTQCLALGDQIGTTFHRGAFQAFLARIRLWQGDLAGALRTGDQALQIATDTAQPWSRSIALRICAETLLAAEAADVANAEQAVRTAIEIQEKRECRCDLAASEIVLSAVLAARGDATGARVAAECAHALYAEMGTAPGIAKARAALSRS